MNIHIKNILFAISILSLVGVLGCGLFGNKELEKVMIDTDLAKQELKDKDDSTKNWDFTRDEGRCFEVTNSKYEGSAAEITLNFASYYGSEAFPDSVFTGKGKVVMTYKAEGNSWKLEKAELKEIDRDITTPDKVSQFVASSASLCGHYRSLLTSRR